MISRFKYFILFVVGSLYCCSEEKLSKENREIEYLNSDTLFTSRGHIFLVNHTISRTENIIQLFYTSDSLKRQYFQKDGEFQGVEFLKYENGNLRSIQWWNNGNNVGQEYQFYKSGKTHQIIDYEKNTTIEYFLTSDEIKQVYNDSIKTEFFLSGKIREKHIEKETEKHHYYYHENSRLSFKGVTKNGILTQNNQPFSGVIYCLFENGDTALTEHYNEGKIQFKSTRLFQPGAPEEIKYFDQNGNLKSHQVFYDNGQPMFVQYNENDSINIWFEDGERWN